MDYSVAKIGGKNFPLHRFENYEANTGSDFVSFVFDFFVKLKELSFVVNLKRQSVDGVPFIFSGVKVSSEQIV